MNTPNSNKRRINPWLFLVAAFLLLISAWTTLIVIAMRHSPERISIVKPER
ncbi:MAG: hypothetical protein ACNA8L_00390 [Luteolibacter sp.]